MIEFSLEQPRGGVQFVIPPGSSPETMVSVCVCVRACVHASVHACVRELVSKFLQLNLIPTATCSCIHLWMGELIKVGAHHDVCLYACTYVLIW